LGGRNIDLDAENGIAKYVLAEPLTIDLAAIEKAAFGAGYNLQWVEVTISGRTVMTDGALHLEAPGTGQRFVIHGQTEQGELVTVRGRLTAPVDSGPHGLTPES